MKFVLNDKVYKVSSVQEIESILLIEEKVRKDIISLLYYMTRAALLGSIDTMLNLSGTGEEYQPSLVKEVTEFRDFLSAVEREDPTVLIRAREIIQQAKEGRFSLNGEDIFVVMEKPKDETDTTTGSSQEGSSY